MKLIGGGCLEAEGESDLEPASEIRRRLEVRVSLGCFGLVGLCFPATKEEPSPPEIRWGIN